MRYKLAIFDLDGTILDTLADLAGSLNYALAAMSMPERSLGEVRSFVGNGVRKLVARSVPAGTSEALAEQVYGCFGEHYKCHCADNTVPYDGIPAVIGQLREAGMMTAVVSNKDDYAVKLLCARFFPGGFDAALGSRDGVPRKPAPDMVHEVLAQLSVPPGRAVYIGDSEVDIETAAAAGMDCISVDWGFRDRDFLLARGAGPLASTPAALETLIMAE